MYPEKKFLVLVIPLLGIIKNVWEKTLVSCISIKNNNKLYAWKCN